MTPEWFTQAVQMQPQEHTTDLDGRHICLSYWPGAEDTSDLLVFVHGTGAHRHWWDFVAPQFVGDYAVVAGDLTGMGDSEHQENYSMRGYADEVAQWIEAVKGFSQPRRIKLVGHSMGGFVAMWLLQNYPDLVTTAVVVDSPIRPPDYDYTEHESSAPIRRRKVYPDRESALQRFRLTPPQECANDYIVDYIAQRSLTETADGHVWKFDDTLMQKMGWRERDGLKRPEEFSLMPYFVYGTQSVLVSEGVLEHIQTLFPKDRVISVEDAAHHVFLDQPLEFIRVIQNILKGDG